MPSKDVTGSATKRKQHLKKEALTKVSASASSDSDNDDSTTPTVETSSSHPVRESKKRKVKRAAENGLQITKSRVDSPPNTVQQSITDDEAEQAFTSLYLRQLTSEFDRDLDKLRAAPDFKEQSLPLLIDALKQGRSCFDKQARLDIGRSVASSKS